MCHYPASLRVNAHIVVCLAGERLAAFEEVAARRRARLTVRTPAALLGVPGRLDADLVVLDPALFGEREATLLLERLPGWGRRVALYIDLTPTVCRVVADLIPLGVRHIVIDPYDPLPEFLDALIDLAERDRPG
jgi:hypothetical protein